MPAVGIAALAKYLCSTGAGGAKEEDSEKVGRTVRSVDDSGRLGWLTVSKRPPNKRC